MVPLNKFVDFLLKKYAKEWLKKIGRTLVVINKAIKPFLSIAFNLSLFHQSLTNKIITDLGISDSQRRSPFRLISSFTDKWPW